MFSGVSRVKIVPFLRFYNQSFYTKLIFNYQPGAAERSNDVHKVRLGDSSWKGV